MKKVIIVSVMAGLVITMVGCVGPLYTNEPQHTAGLGVGLFGSGAARQARVNRMAIAKLDATPVQIGVMTPTGAVAAVSTANNTNTVSAGYLGVIANMSTHRRLQFDYSGPETGTDYLGPGEQLPKYLLPGIYHGVIRYGGQIVGWKTFKSEPVEKSFLGKKFHWIFGSEW